jgi:nitrous oxide reductase accessory protein NosL
MSLRDSIAGLLLVAAVGSLGVVGYRRFVQPVHGCDVCGRDLHPGMRAAVSLEQGERVDACCPRCALHLAATQPEKVARITVEDHATGASIDGRAAVYLEGSDVEGCASAGESTPREPGVPYERIFDRCLPSLVAFRAESDARAFQKEHGGRLLSFVEASQHVRHR